MKIHLKIWRQKGPKEKGRLVDYDVDDVSEEMSFLEMMDVLNMQLVENGEEAIAFDHDCREGICGTCGLVINGEAHGPGKGTTTCQLHMREYKDGDTVYIEPWKAKAFPIIKDLVVDRSSLDRVIQSGGFVSVNTGGAPDANALPIRKENAEMAFDAASCIGCGACVAACKNASASLFVAAKISHLALVPQGATEAKERALNMVLQMEEEGFGHCTNTYACEAKCPKEISVTNIARMNRHFTSASLSSS